MKAALLASLLLAASASARADEAHDLAADIVARTGSEASVDKVLALIRAQVVAMIAAKSGKTSEEAGAIVDQVLMPSFMATLPQIHAAMSEVFTRDYDLADLRALDAFYRSPAGQHLISRQPVVTADTIRAVVAMTGAALARIERERAQQLRQRGVTL